MADWDVVSQEPLPQQSSNDPWAVVSQDPMQPGEPQGTQPGPMAQPQMGGGEAFAAGAARGALPAIASGFGAEGGARAGAALGARLGAAAGPVGAVAGGVLGAAGAAFGASTAEDWVLDKLGLKQGTGLLSDQEAQQAQAQHPWAFHAGDLLDSLLAFGSNPAGAVARLAGAGMGAALEGGQEYAQEGKLDPGKIALSAGVGAVLGGPRKWVTNSLDAVAAKASGLKGTGSGAAQNTVQDQPGAPGRPDIGGTPAEGADSNDIEVANDVTTTARGVAAENPPAPQVSGAGNPVGAPMLAREAADPSDPGRDYGKGSPAGNGGVETVPGTSTVQTGPIDTDVAAALAPSNPQPAEAAQSAEAPALATPPPAAGTTPAPLPNGRVPIEETGGQPPAQSQQQAPGGTAPPAGTVPVRLHNQWIVGGPFDLHVPPHVAAILADPEFQQIMQAAQVNRGNHVPYGAGADANAPLTHIDQSIPRFAILPNKQSFNTAPPMVLHEQIEKFVMDRLIKGGMEPGAAYKVAHWAYAEPAEDAWYRARGIDPKVAEQWWAKQLPGIQNAPIKNLPGSLYQKPYPHDNAALAHEGGVSTQQPSEAELRQAHGIMHGEQAVPTEAAPAEAGAAEAPAEKSNLPAPVTGAVTQAEPVAPKAGEIEGEFTPVPQEQPASVQAWQERFPNANKRLQKLAGDQYEAGLARLAQMSPAEQEQVAQALERGSRGLEGRRPTVAGLNVQARTAKDAAARSAALDAIGKAVKANPGDGTVPVSTPDKQALITRLKNIVNAVDQDPAVKSAGSWINRMREKPPEVQIYKAAKQLLNRKNPTVKQYQDFVSLEQQLSGPNAAEAARETQATKRINADIELKRAPTTDEAEAAGAAGEQAIERQTFERMPPQEDYRQVNGKTIPVDRSYEHAYNAAADWLNGLSNADYETIASHYDLGAEMDEPADPAALLKDMQNTLRQQQARSLQQRPGVIEPVPAEEAPGIEKPVRTAADVAALEKPTARPEEDELARLIREQQADAEKTERNSVPSTNGGLLNRVKNFVGSDEGSLKILPFLFKPKAPQAVQETVEELRTAFNQNEGAVHRVEALLRSHLAAAEGAGMSKQERIEAYRKYQERAQMTPKEQKFIDDFYKPLLRRYNSLYGQARLYDPSLPAPYAGGKTEFIPRMKVPEEKSSINDLPWVHTLSDFDPAEQERDFFALDNGQGDRLVFKMTNDGNLGIIRNGNTTVVKNLPAGFTGQPGQSIPLKIKGKTGVYKVDHARTPEIMQNVPGQNYVEDGVITLSNAIYNMQKALIRGNMLKQLQANPTIGTFSTTDKQLARSLGYQPTKLPEMQQDGNKTKYYHPSLAWLLDDFARPGVGGWAFDKLGRWANYMARPLYAVSPGFHPLNVAAQYMIGTPALVARANSLKQVGGWAHKYLPDLYDAYKEVWSQNGNDLNELRSAGGRLMYDSQLFNKGLIEDAVNNFGIKLAGNPGPVMSAAKALGVPDVATDLPRMMMQKSNRFTWMANDIMLLSMYKTAKRLGLSPTDAAEAIHNYIGAYRATQNQTLLGSRIAQQIANEPALAWFGPYHADLWHTLSHIAKGMVAPVDAAHGREAYAAALATAGLTFGVFPYLIDPAVQWLTGNPDASSGRRGLAALADVPRLMAEGNEQGWRTVANNFLTPSIIRRGADEFLNNQDWKGQPIRSEGAPLPMQVGEVADWAARTAIPPYGNVASLARQQGVTVGDILKKMAESSVGIKDPSDNARRYDAQRERRNAQAIRQRTRRPEGFIESLTNGE